MRCLSVRELLILASLALAACGGGGGDSAPPSGNQVPIAAISSPAAGATFKAGDTLAYSGSASDPEDGTLDEDRLTWWAELHHDTHEHPFMPERGGAGGSVSIPVRGETSSNSFYRFHLRATDSAGATAEVTRDVLPRKSRLTLLTQPPGLGLLLDGQPVTGGHALTGVVGLERDLGAVFEQVVNGRRYRFASWSDGGSREHEISTPEVDTTYTATFEDLGPATNQAPTVSLSVAATGTLGVPITLSATAADSDGAIAKVDFLEAGVLIASDSSAPYSVSWTPTVQGTRGMSARATDNLGAQTTSAVVNVSIAAASGSDTQPPVATLTSPSQFADGLTGTVTLSATASDNVGVTGVEFQVDGIAIGAIDSSAPYQTSIVASAYTAGQHVIRARARDAAGNQSPWASATVRFGGSVAIPQGFTLDDGWVSGLENATAFAKTPDGRLLVSKQTGSLLVVKNGVLLPTPFVSLTVDPNGERGLLGVAVHPNFASNGFVYVYYTTPSGGVHNRISRFVANGDVATGTETVLRELPALSSATNHNGGAMHFGVDGKLYVGVGDNAQGALSQNLTSPFGKLLRFNDDGSIPSDNPICTTSALACAVWAYGLRNPFTFAIQPSTGRMHINDVGQSSWEEVNLGAPGANFGWPQSEGATNVGPGVTAPLFAYAHSDASPPGSGPGGFLTGFAITGGLFLPSTSPFPSAYRGNYYFADYVSDYIARMDLANGNAVYSFARVSAPLQLLMGNDGALYILTRFRVMRLSYP
jgi:glucose/arabinose dehydrogenase